VDEDGGSEVDMSCHVGCDLLPHSRSGMMFLGLVDITHAHHQDAPHTLPTHMEKHRDVYHTHYLTALSVQRWVKSWRD
jgi:hypothetical protein